MKSEINLRMVGLRILNKINGTPKSVNLNISKLHSILAVANLLAHNNISHICYCDQISLQSAAVNCSFSDNVTPLGVPFILLAMVPVTCFFIGITYYCAPDMWKQNFFSIYSL